jgi:hypothetical protein
MLNAHLVLGTLGCEVRRVCVQLTLRHTEVLERLEQRRSIEWQEPG